MVDLAAKLNSGTKTTLEKDVIKAFKTRLRGEVPVTGRGGHLIG